MIKGYESEREYTSARGQRFQMDFVLIHGNFKLKTEDGKLDDRYTAYLLISDEYPWSSWCFLVNIKDPPITIVHQLLDKHANKSGPRYIRTNQGGDVEISNRD